MPKTLEQLIKDAKEALDKTENGSKEQAAALARHEALTSVRDAGITKTQDDLNRIDRQAKEGYENSIKEALGMTLDEFKQVMAGVEESLSDDAGGEEGEGNVLARMQAALEERDGKIDSLSTTLNDVNTRYSKDKVEAAIERAFQGAKLDERFLGPAKSLASYSDLIEKASRGEEVTAEEINGKVENVKALSGVWFKADEDEGAGSLVAGHRIKEEAVSPGIPATPQAGGPSEITDEDRAKRASSVY